MNMLRSSAMASILATGMLVGVASTLTHANYTSPVTEGTFVYPNDKIVSVSGSYKLEWYYETDTFYSPSRTFVSLDHRGPNGQDWYSYNDDNNNWDWTGYGTHVPQEYESLEFECGEESCSPSPYLLMQNDGNLVLYDAFSNAVWATHTEGNPHAYFDVQGDGNMVVYSSDDEPLWSLFGGPQ